MCSPWWINPWYTWVGRDCSRSDILPAPLGAQEGEPSYKLYKEEKAELLASLKRRAVKLHKTLVSLDGITCTEPEGGRVAEGFEVPGERVDRV